MYLRAHRKKNPQGGVYTYWSLVEAVRTSRGPRQRRVATLGKLPGLDRQVHVGWEHISDILDGRLKQADLLEEPEPPPAWATVDTQNMRVERLRRFGEVYLALALWRRLKLDVFFDEALPEGREEISWKTMACILTLARFCAPSSELQIAQSWYSKTALEDLLGVSPEKINEDRLYRALDVLLPHKDALFGHFQQVYGELFGITFDLLLYDITSTYFEGQGAHNAQAKRGYSRDKRPDCLQVCIALVVTPEGLPLAYEVFDGNRSDSTTVEEIVTLMRTKYGQEQRTWVMDRGMVSADNLDMLRQCGASYLVGAPKSMLKQFEARLLEQDWASVTPEVELKLCEAPDGGEETFVLCRSARRVEKERAIRQRPYTRLEQALEKLKGQIDATHRTLRNRSTAERRVGRLFQKYARAARFFEVQISEHEDPKHKRKTRLAMKIHKKTPQQDWAEMSDGCYLLRTNLKGKSPEELWKTYIGLTQIEDSFRITKHDMGLRPIYHQKTDRTQAHILVCFLALTMWRTLQQWMEGCGLGTAPRKLLDEMAEVRSLDVVLPTGANREIRLRTVSHPEKHLACLLQQLEFPLPNKSKTIKM